MLTYIYAGVIDNYQLSHVKTFFLYDIYQQNTAAKSFQKLLIFSQIQVK